MTAASKSPPSDSLGSSRTGSHVGGSPNVAAIEAALHEQRWETARRLCLAALAHQPGDQRLLLLLHAAYRALGDTDGTRRTLEQYQAIRDANPLTLLLLQAEDAHDQSEPAFYFTSPEAAAGYTLEEYQERKHQEAERLLNDAKTLAQSPAARWRVANVLRKCGRAVEADALCPPSLPHAAATTDSVRRETGSLFGTLRFADQSPVAQATVTLGTATSPPPPAPVPHLHQGMHYHPPIPQVESLTTTTDADGRYAFANVPAGEHAFLAVTLDPDQHDIPTRFLAHGVRIAPHDRTQLDAVVDTWRSAASVPPPMALPDHLQDAKTGYRLVWQHLLRNPFHYDFPRQAVTIDLPSEVPADARRLRLVDSRQPHAAIPLQIVDGKVVFLGDLPAMSEHRMGLYLSDAPASHDAAPASIFRDRDGEQAIIDTGAACFRIAWGDGNAPLPPLLAVQGADGAWRGQGRLVLPAGIIVRRRGTTVLDDGPVLLRVRIEYEFDGGRTWAFTFTAHRDEPNLLVHEQASALDGARFEFSLREFGSGRGRGFLLWKSHACSQDWRTLQAAEFELARLQESVPWWVPPAGFGYAMTPDGLAEQDYIGVYTIRRGDWIDPAFERIAAGPGDDPAWRRELDWPYPEMVGSTISMITAHTDAGGDAFFRFASFDGERRWGLCVSTLDRNDGPMKQISEMQHKNSSPTIEQFMTWHLDEPDTIERPHVLARRDQLRDLRRKRQSPVFGRFWRTITESKQSGSVAGLRFAVEGDPLLAWRKKAELVGVAHVRARMTLLGREFSDMYSPVGGRPITTWAEEYDLLAASGVFTDNEERLVRAFFILMGHLYMSPDLMNWKYGSRNANFEADRVDVVGTIGVVFHGHPDSATFTDHAMAQMRRSLETYCTPGSGKWYENPACYYLHASKCRMNLLVHLANAGLFDPTTLPRLKEFLRWGILLLTPPFPQGYALLRDRCNEEAYRTASKARRIAPIGDHALLGRWLPEHYALAARMYRESDPTFADELLWAYQSGSTDGGHHGNIPLLFARLDEEDLKPAPAPRLASRRLEGFGAIFRDHFNEANELYLLFKQGPGGYRYHRTEGSIILFANGQPLVYDGGEAGETWRHTTLSFHPVHMPLAAGHVERFCSMRALTFCQGVHPLALRPGQPTFLSDVCSHDLVDEAIRRYHEPQPANARSVWQIGDHYIILHDELSVDPDVPSFWHLQVVADSHTGDWRSGYTFKGRYGTDLQVLLPDQQFAAETITQQPMLEYDRCPAETFAMRHLQLQGQTPQHYLAVLRPLYAERRPLNAQAVVRDGRTVGVQLRGEGIDDLLLLARTGCLVEHGEVRFDGRYGAVLRRGDSRVLAVLDGTHLRDGSVELHCRGVTAELSITPTATTLTIEGAGECEVHGLGKPFALRSTGPRRHAQVM